MRNAKHFAFVGFGLLIATGCGTGSASDTSSVVEDTSTSGTAATVVGSALGDSAGGTLAFTPSPKPLFQACDKVMNAFLPSSHASNDCPTFATTTNGCFASGTSMWIAENSCNQGTSAATRTGVKLLAMSSGTARCGSFPRPTGASATLTRQYVSASNSNLPATLTRVNTRGTTVTVDDATANAGNFDNQTIAPLINGGYGTQQVFATSGSRGSVIIKERTYVTGKYDHSVAGTLTISESAAASDTRILNGSLTVYHNLLKVVGTSVFSNVGHTDKCCVPTSGKITTTFAAGANIAPTVAGAKWVGKSEVLSFTGCGTGTLVSADGTSAVVNLNNCF